MLKRILLLVGVAAMLLAALFQAGSASAQTADNYRFTAFGTVVVTGNIDFAVHFTTYRISNTACTGTTFPGDSNACYPQTATDDVVIPAGEYAGQSFTIGHADCGPVQEDVYGGAEQTTIGSPGTSGGNLIAGSLQQLPACATTAPTGTAPTGTTTTGTTTAATPTATATTSAPAASATSAAASVVATATSRPDSSPTTSGAVVPVVKTSSQIDAASASATDPLPQSTTVATAQLASTGAGRPITTAVLAALLIAAGAGITFASRTSRRQH